MPRKALTLTVLLCLAGCASVQVNQAAAPSLKAGRSVEIGVPSEATVGSIILSEYSYFAAQRAVTKASFESSIGLAKVLIPAASQLVKADIGGEVGYCTVQGAFFAPLEPPRSICLFDPRASGNFEKFYIINTLSSIRYDASIPYSLGELTSGTTGYKYELLYQGMAGDVLKVAYREYTDNLARPAFQQDLSYTLRRTGPTEISFRDVSIQVDEADNNRIRYRVMKGFKN